MIIGIRVLAVGAVAAALVVACGSATDLLTSSAVAGEGSGSGSGTGSGSGSGPGTSCQALQACCTMSLPAAAQSGCTQLVDMGNEATCSQAISQVQAAGFCGGAPGSGSGRGVPVPVGCEMLASCCPSLPAASLSSCTAVVSAGNEAVCLAQLDSIAAQGVCVGGSVPPPSPCTQLGQCCMTPTFNARKQAACELIAAKGAAEACVLAEGTYCGH